MFRPDGLIWPFDGSLILAWILALAAMNFDFDFPTGRELGYHRIDGMDSHFGSLPEPSGGRI
jgi:hypothetical protein